MALFNNFFGGKKSGGEGDDASPSSGGAKLLPRSPQKAKQFFDHAKAVAEAANYDYAIECYVNGLRHDPMNLPAHEALREVAKKRRVAGGKAAGAFEVLGFKGKDVVEKMTLVAERIWAMKPLDPDKLVDFIKAAAYAHVPEQGIDMKDVMKWAASLILKERAFERPATLNHYVIVTDHLFMVGEYPSAVEACRVALSMDRNNPVLQQRLKDIDTQRALSESQEKSREQGSRGIMKNAKEQDELYRSENAANEDQVEENIRVAKRNWDAAPDDTSLMQKYIAALMKPEADKFDEIAITTLREVYEKTTMYRYKSQIGDMRIRMYDRRHRELKKQFDAAPDNVELKKKIQDNLRAKLLFEVGEFAERVKEIPTDRALKYEYARRLLDTGKVEEAIGLLQVAKTDARLTTKANHVLGRAFMKQNWIDLAISAFEEGLRSHATPTDKAGLDMHYCLMDAKEKQAVATNDIKLLVEAQKHASFIMQNDIKFLDVRTRLDGMVRLMDKIRSGGGGGAGAAQPSPA
jgi:hypothetical protein